MSGTFLGGSVSTGDMLDRSLWTEVTAASATKHTTTKLHIHVYCDVLHYTKHVTKKILYLLLMQQYLKLLKCLSFLIFCKKLLLLWFWIYPILNFIFSIRHREYQWKLTMQLYQYAQIHETLNPKIIETLVCITYIMQKCIQWNFKPFKIHFLYLT